VINAMKNVSGRHLQTRYCDTEHITILSIDSRGSLQSILPEHELLRSITADGGAVFDRPLLAKDHIRSSDGFQVVSGRDGDWAISKLRMPFGSAHRPFVVRTSSEGSWGQYMSLFRLGGAISIQATYCIPKMVSLGSQAYAYEAFLGAFIDRSNQYYRKSG
jgi:hypothetical protein